MELNSKEQSSSPQKQGVKARSKSTEEIQPAKKVIMPAQPCLDKEPPLPGYAAKGHRDTSPTTSRGPRFTRLSVENFMTREKAFQTPQKSLPNQMDGDESKGSCPVPAPSSTQQQQQQT